MTALPQIILNHADKFAHKQGQYINLGDPDAIYWIADGEIDIYLAEYNESHVGPYHHLYRFHEGQLIFGFEKQTSAAKCHAYAKCFTFSQIYKISIKKLLQLLKNTDQVSSKEQSNLKNHLATHVERWVTGLMQHALLDMPPLHYDVVPSQAHFCFIQESCVSTKDDLLWMNISQSCCYLYGLSNLAFPPSKLWVPVVNKAWFMAEARAEIKTLPTNKLALNPQYFESILHFNDFISTLFQEKIKQRHKEEWQKAQEKIVVDQEIMRKSNIDMLRVLGETNIHSDLQVEVDKVMQVMQYIASKINLTIKPQTDEERALPNIQRLERIFNKSKISTRTVKLSDNWYKKEHGVLIGFRKFNNDPIALSRESNGQYKAYDPGKKSIYSIDKTTAKHLQSNAYEVYDSLPKDVLNISSLLSLTLQSLAPAFAKLFFISIVISLIALVTPLSAGVLIDAVIPSANLKQLSWFAIALIVTALTIFLLSYARALLLTRLVHQTIYFLQTAVWERLIRLPFQFHQQYSAGELTFKAATFLRILMSFSIGTLEVIITIIFSLINFFILFYISVPLGWVASLLIATNIICILLFTKIISKHELSVNCCAEKLMGCLHQIISGVSKIRLTGSEVRAYRYWSSHMLNYKTVKWKSDLLQNLLKTFLEVYPFLASGILYYSVAISHQEQLLTTGEFITFNIAFTSLLVAISSLDYIIISLVDVSSNLDRLKPVLSTRPEVHKSAQDPKTLHGHIIVDRLSFRYPDTQNLILRNISFTVESGSFVALVGASGSGKTTLLNLLLNFLQPSSGRIYFDAKDLANLDIELVRRQIGVVLQDDSLIPASIRANICGSQKFTADEVMSVLKLVGFDQDLKKMPMGIETIVNIGGGGLSGGQRQRLLIARALINKPRILFFDEATSAMDNRSQNAIIELLQGYQATRIIVAHRLSTIIHANIIIAMRDGEIVEMGKFNELMAKKGYFYELCKNQLL